MGVFGQIPRREDSARCFNITFSAQLQVLTMTSLGEVQRIIGLSLSKIQMGRNQRGGLPLHKNLLVATVLNKARDVYMQETMYMNYRLMACGQFNQEEHEDIEDDDTPDTEDYEEDSESDVEDDNDSSASKDYSKEFVGPSCVPTTASSPSATTTSKTVDNLAPVASGVTGCCVTTGQLLNNNIQHQPESGHQDDNTTCATVTNDEGFIDESDCDCDARNFSEDGENRVPFQYCFSCAPFHPSNGRGPTLVGPQLPLVNNCSGAQPQLVQEQEDKLIYDMDLKSTQNQPCVSLVKRKRQISSEEIEDAVNSILPKKRRDSCSNGEENLDDSGYQEEEKVFHPAFRDQCVAANGMEVDQITSLVSIFSFGQQVFNNTDSAANNASSSQSGSVKKSSKEDDDSDSDSDTSSDSGHSSDDHETNNDETRSDTETRNDPAATAPSSRSDANPDLQTCLAQAKDKDLEVSTGCVTAAV